MEMTKELMEKAKAAKTAEELLDLAKAQGIAMEKEEAEAQCHYLNDIGGYPAPFFAYSVVSWTVRKIAPVGQLFWHRPQFRQMSARQTYTARRTKTPSRIPAKPGSANGGGSCMGCIMESLLCIGRIMR